MLMCRSAGTGADGYLILLRLCDEDIGVKKQISLHNQLTAEAVLTRGGTDERGSRPSRTGGSRSCSDWAASSWAASLLFFLLKGTLRGNAVVGAIASQQAQVSRFKHWEQGDVTK